MKEEQELAEKEREEQLKKKRMRQKLFEEEKKREQMRELEMKKEVLKENKLRYQITSREEKKKNLLHIRNANLKYKNVNDVSMKELVEKNIGNQIPKTSVDSSKKRDLYEVDWSELDEEPDDIFDTFSKNSFLLIEEEFDPVEKNDANNITNVSSIRTENTNVDNNITTGNTHIYKEYPFTEKKLEQRNFLKETKNQKYESLYFSDSDGANTYGNNRIEEKKKKEAHDNLLSSNLQSVYVTTNSRSFENNRNLKQKDSKNTMYKIDEKDQYTDLYFDIEKKKLEYDAHANDAFSGWNFNVTDAGKISNDKIKSKGKPKPPPKHTEYQYRANDPYTNYSFEKLFKENSEAGKGVGNISDFKGYSDNENDTLFQNIMFNIDGLNKKIKDAKRNYRDIKYKTPYHEKLDKGYESETESDINLNIESDNSDNDNDDENISDFNYKNKKNLKIDKLGIIQDMNFETSTGDLSDDAVDFSLTKINSKSNRLKPTNFSLYTNNSEMKKNDISYNDAYQKNDDEENSDSLKASNFLKNFKYNSKKLPNFSQSFY